MNLRAKTFLLLATIANIIICASCASSDSCYAMGGEVLVISKEEHSGCYWITIKEPDSLQGSPGGEFKLACTGEQYFCVGIGDVIDCDRTQNAATHDGTIQRINKINGEKVPA